MLIYGAGDCGRQFLDSVHLAQADLQIMGVFDDRAGGALERIALPKVDGTSDDLLRLAQERHVDEVIIALPQEAQARVGDLAAKFCALPASITLATGGSGCHSKALRRRVLIRGHQSRSYYKVKSVIDRTLATLISFCALPLMLAIAVMIKVDSPGPSLFRQSRYGRNGKVFGAYKFRTLRHECADYLGARQTHTGDERVTRVGGLLRRTCLDELPQLFNVIKGDMSLVGPRPHPIGMRTEGKLCSELIPGYFLRYRLKPGITGWAQVHGWRGGVVTVNQLRRRFEYDLYYVEHASFSLDLRTIGLTALLLIRGAGQVSSALTHAKDSYVPGDVRGWAHGSGGLPHRLR